MPKMQMKSAADTQEKSGSAVVQYGYYQTSQTPVSFPVLYKQRLLNKIGIRFYSMWSSSSTT